MARVYEIDSIVPVIDPTAFVHPDAVLVGDVIIGPRAYIGPLASLRGDFGRITVGAGANVQDGCVVHCFPGTDTVVDEDGHIGHGAVLHGCRVGRGVLVGMNAVVMDGVELGAYAFVAANSFVKAGTVVPEKHLAAGTPAAVVRELTETELAWKANGTRVYQDLAARSLVSLRPATPLTAVEPDRRRVSTDSSVAVPLHTYRERNGER
ncbi:gamma carbonic anhydrase family protein [Yinghuangia seranimata]|uniref:gamma carbonic anhydrase family protein n=1 Tax=Yinghuangia seranimata TaxID=408067 RepID=UPI00248C004A|nr:gamma carbonic anhydrase family protein [Yinghuangia seranimata]MDI2131540.1 gamma carbonic anhydrase family protein [Yinghuangia seranimata]